MKMERETCAFNRGRDCAVLTRSNCEGCTFFKTKEQLDESRKKASDRLNILPNEQKMYIAAKYHNPDIIPVKPTDEQV